MQRRVVKGLPEVKDALGDFGKLGHDLTEPLFFSSVRKLTHPCGVV